MPAASSPYTRNDYAAVSNFRPYQLPINDIFKAISAQNQFWDQGAERVKSVYDNALDLHLSLAPNQELRNQYMAEAEKQLTKLSSMDLSDPSVQRQGFNIFRPLFNDEGIMSDDAATRHIEKVNNDAMRFRDSNNGKGYSATNHQYGLMGAREFKNSTDRMAGKAYLQQAKEYEPLYDPAGEINNIIMNCKPDKATNSSVQGFYIDSYSSESLSSAKINSCLDAGLSDKARRQLQINGAVTYKDQPFALRDKYLPYLNGTISQLSQQKAAMQGVLANKDNLKNLSQDELNKLGIADVSQVTPEFLQALQQNADNLDVRIHNLQETTGKLANGDLSPISGDNFETVAGTVFSRDYMQNVGEGFSYDFNTNTRKADPVQMMFYQQAQLNARNTEDNQYRLKEKEMDLNNDRLKRSISSGSLRDILTNPNGQSIIDFARQQNDTNNPFTAIDKADSYDQVTLKRQQIAQERGQLNTWLNTQARAFGMPAEIRQNSPEETQWLNNWELTSRGDPTKEQIIRDYHTKMDRYIALEDMYKNTQDAVDKQVAPLVQSLDKQIASVSPVQLSDGKTVTPQMMTQAMASPGVNVNGLVWHNNGGPALSFMTYNGKDIQGGISAYEDAKGDIGSKLFPLLSNVRGKVTDKAIQVASSRNELMQRQTVLQHEGFLFPELNQYDEKNPEMSLKGKIAQQLGMTGKNLIDKITIGQTDLNGRLIVTLAPPLKNETDYGYNEAKKSLLTFGGGTNKEIRDDKEGYQVMLTGISQLDLVDENNLSSIMKPYIRSLEANSSITTPKSTGYMRSGNGQSYRLDVSQNPGGTYTYKIVDSSKPNSPVGVYNTREEALANFDVWMDLYKQKELNAR